MKKKKQKKTPNKRKKNQTEKLQQEWYQLLAASCLLNPFLQPANVSVAYYLLLLELSTSQELSTSPEPMSLQFAVLGQAFPLRALRSAWSQVVTRNYHLLTSLHRHIAGTKTRAFPSGKDAPHILGLKPLNPVILLIFLAPIYCCSALACPHSSCSTLLFCIYATKFFPYCLLFCLLLFCSNVSIPSIL